MDYQSCGDSFRFKTNTKFFFIGQRGQNERGMIIELGGL